MVASFSNVRVSVGSSSTRRTAKRASTSACLTRLNRRASFSSIVLPGSRSVGMCRLRNRPRRRVFRSSLAELQMEKDSLAERSEFELPVPVSKLSDDSIMLSFATSRRVVKRSHPGLHLWRAVGLSLKRTVPKWIALSGRISRGVAHADEENASLERRDSNARPEWSSGP